MRTKGTRQCIGLVCTNFDGSIDEALAQRLLQEYAWGEYTAWYFFGCVWYEEERFCVEIRQHGAHVATLYAPNIETLMQLACEQYGTE